MGWTVVEPLSPGVFQIDPSVYGAEHLRVFHGAGTAGKLVTAKVLKEMWEKIAKQIVEATSKAVSTQIGKKVGVEVSEEVGESFVERATKELSEETVSSGKNKGKLWSELKNGTAAEKGAYTKALNGKVQKFSDDAAEGMIKGIDPSDIGKTIKLDDVAQANKFVDDAAAKGGKEITEEALEEAGEELTQDIVAEGAENTTKKLDEAKGMSPFQKDVTKFAGKYGLTGVAIYGAYNLLLPISEAVGGVVGDTGDGLLATLTGENCREGVEANYPSNPEVWSEKTEECEAQAAFRTMLMGGATISLLGVLGVVLISRLLPKKSQDDEESEE